jgi:HYDIN/CFA65/VesB family protein
LAPGASCSINVTFAPTARLSRSGSLVIQSNSTPAAPSVALSGTGIAPVAVLTAALSFSPQPVGTTATQAATLSNQGDAPLTITSIAITGDFTQTNNCPASLAAGSSCSVQVSFTPTATGSRTGTLVVNDDDLSSPQQSTSLSGTGVDYSLTASPSSATVRAGSPAAYTVSATALGGAFPGAISLSCSGLPAGAGCAFSPASVSPGSGSASSSLTLSTGNGQHGIPKTPKGTFTITIDGAFSTLKHSATVSLTVQ